MSLRVSRWDLLAATLFLMQYLLSIAMLFGSIPQVILNWTAASALVSLIILSITSKASKKLFNLGAILLLASAGLAGGIYLFDGERSAIFFIFTFATICAAPIIFFRANITEKGYAVMFLILIIGYAFSQVSGLNGIGGKDNQLVPTAGRLLVNISPPGNTVHFGAIMCGTFLVAIVTRFFLDTSTQKHIIKNVLFALLLFYVILFSQSRVVLLGFLVTTTAAILVKRFRAFTGFRSVALFWALLIGLLGIIFLSEIVGQILASELGGGTLGTILNTDNATTSSGFAAGRSWLWGYHLYLFQQSPFGSGIELVRDLSSGDTTALGRAVAGSESFFTGILAAYGIAGIFVILTITSYFTYASYKGRIFFSIMFLYWVSVSFGASTASPPNGFLFFLITAIASSSKLETKISLRRNM